jgi:hypothetical protein
MRFSSLSAYARRLAFLAFVVGCNEPTSLRKGGLPEIRLGQGASTTGPTVTSALPSAASRDTTLDVQIIGSGFDAGSKATLPLHGQLDSRVRVNTTRYVKSTQLIANVTIASDAVIDFYDVVVVTSAGKKGIGTEAFEVTYLPVALSGGLEVEGVNTAGIMVGRATGSRNCSSSVYAITWGADRSPRMLPLGLACGGWAWAINESGVVLGWLYGVADPNVIWTPSGGSYVLRQLGIAPDGKYPTTEAGINDLGEVIGWAPGAKLYWWSSATGWLAMKVPQGATSCSVYGAINNKGQIAARCTVNGIVNGFYWSSHDADPIQLPHPAAPGDIFPKAMNEAGVIVGFLYGSPTRAVRWTPGDAGYSTVEVLADRGFGGSAVAIDDNGMIAGGITPKFNAAGQAALWSPSGSFQLLGRLQISGGSAASSLALTAQGLLVGGSDGNQSVFWRTGFP